MIASAHYDASANLSYGLRETHGIMEWETHQELHSQIGTYRVSGGQLTTGTYVVNSPVDTANSPGFDVATIKDEDCVTVIPAWVQGTYTTMYVGPGNTSVFNTNSALPYIATTNTYIQVNNTTTGVMTPG